MNRRPIRTAGIRGTGVCALVALPQAANADPSSPQAANTLNCAAIARSAIVLGGRGDAAFSTDFQARLLAAARHV
jgi:hypothetical protein